MGAAAYLDVRSADSSLARNAQTSADITQLCKRMGNAYDYSHSTATRCVAGMDVHSDITQHLLLWQISQLNYICGSVHIELQQLISTINSLFGFLCEDNQALVVDALVDEAGTYALALTIKVASVPQLLIIQEVSWMKHWITADSVHLLTTQSLYACFLGSRAQHPTYGTHSSLC